MSIRRPTREQLAGAFADRGVAAAYRYRPPYPPETFDVLERLISDRPRNVLDLGAGAGALARPLAASVDHVDALDVSAAMLAAGRGQPGGRRQNLRWVLGATETSELPGPYALATAGASLHWMSWQQTLARLCRVLTERAYLAIADCGYQDPPWSAGLNEIIARHSRNPGYDPEFSVPDELAARELLEIAGRATAGPMPFRQSVRRYVEHFHSTATLARMWMPARESAAFDDAVGRLVQPYAAGGMLHMTVVAHITWGRPTEPA